MKIGSVGYKLYGVGFYSWVSQVFWGEMWGYFESHFWVSSRGGLIAESLILTLTSGDDALGKGLRKFDPTHLGLYNDGHTPLWRSGLWIRLWARLLKGVC